MPNVCTDIDRLRVSKANRLIEIKLLEQNVKLNTRDQKITLAVISQISPDDTMLQHYSLTLGELSEITGISMDNLTRKGKSGDREIDLICDRLTQYNIRIKRPEEPDGNLSASWFADAEYIPSKGIVEFGFSQKLKPYLLSLKSEFTTYLLKQVVTLKSPYSIRLYELLRQFLSLKAVRNGTHTAFRQISLEDLRYYLGVEDINYQRFSDFRRYVLEYCQTELLSKTDIAFDYTVKRLGRKAGLINFSIRHNPKFEEIKEEDITGDHIPVNNQEVNLEAENFVRAAIQMQLPEINLIEQDLILKTYPREMIMESLLSLSTIEIRTTRKKAFLGILSGKRKDEQQAADSSDSDEDFSWLQKDF